MNLKSNIERRLKDLESKLRPGSNCSRCMAMASKHVSKEELDAQIQAYLSGNWEIISNNEPLPEPSPTCPHCQKLAIMSEEEVDAKIRRYIEAREKYKWGYRA
jgi:hypothetical protein